MKAIEILQVLWYLPQYDVFQSMNEKGLVCLVRRYQGEYYINNSRLFAICNDGDNMNKGTQSLIMRIGV